MNRLYTISEGSSRFSKGWQPVELPFERLVEKLTKTKRTKETMAEFLAMPISEQTKIKDVGGFVGGKLKDGRRGNYYVESRSLVTLDLDNCYPEVLEEIKLYGTYECIVYSTHKHTKEKPRLRIILPLARDVSKEEYEPIARKVAEQLGVDFECFDGTTFEPARLMFYPSTPKDAEFIGEHIKGEIIDPDKILKLYKDFKDPMEWPRSSSEKKERTHLGNKPGDPSEKPGLVGCFNRIYGIDEAIEMYLSKVYEPYSNGRYTYIGASTSGGLVVYDNKFAYSNHSTDPCSQQLCNAFDLVRIHKFGAEDKDIDPNTPLSKRPSYISMKDYIKKYDDDVTAEFDKFKVEFTKENIAKKTNPTDILENEWIDQLEINDKGHIIDNYHNALLILANDPKIAGIVGLNSFRGFPEIRKEPPWVRTPGNYWTDADESQLRGYLNSVYGLKAQNFIRDALAATMEHNSFNPVKDFINSVTWDGIPRIETLFIDYLGAEDTSYVRKVTRKMMIAAVARIFEPGIKFDYMVTLVGKQGIGKSLLIKKLGRDWSSDSLTSIRGKEAYEALDGVWLMEIGELAALKKAERESIKLFISKTEDTYRRAYARNTTVSKRRCIFIGTTNDETFLNDDTGSRRFLVIDTHEEKTKRKVWDGLTPEEVKQLWAEAKSYYDAKENIMEMDLAVRKVAVEEQIRHSEDNPYTGIIDEFLRIPLTPNWSEMTTYERSNYFGATSDFRKELLKDSEKTIIRDHVSAIEIWVECFHKSMDSMKKLDSRQIGDALRQLGWLAERFPRRFGPYGTQRSFTKTIGGKANE